jgi:mRNA interferase RelE/StbE
MVSYKIELSSTAEKQIKKLQKDDQVRVMRSALGLSRDPRPHGCRKMKGFDNIYRIRVGVFRVIYSVEEKRIVVVILKVGHKKDVYR